MAKLKGNIFSIRLAFVEARFDAEQRERYLAALKPETRELLESRPTAEVWVPFEAHAEATEMLDRAFATGDLSLATEAGRYSAEAALGGMRDAIATAGPTFLFRQAPSVWNQHYDSGTVDGGLLSRTHGVFRIVGFQGASAAHCASVGGWIARTLELSGVEDVAVDHSRCVARGDDVCEYECRWRLR